MEVVCKGWLSKYLQTQMQGLTGHIEEAGFPFDRVEWGKDDVECNNDNPNWWVYEQTGYWLDGFTRCAILLDDRAAIERTSKIIYQTINSPDRDGYIGPRFMKADGEWNRWPHVVFFRACIALYESNGDESIIRAIARHYLQSPANYSRGRDVLNVEIMLYVYGVLRDEALLRLAIDSYETYQRTTGDDLKDEVALSDKKPFLHGVSYNEYSKLGAILYKYTGEKKYLKASLAAFHKIDRYFMLPGGCNCSDEYVADDGYMRGIETCDVSDYTWSLHYLLQITKDAGYADKIERCVFNAGIGAATEDFKALQYFSCANQLVLNRTSNHCRFYHGSKWMSYRPNPGTECCPGNVNRFMPNYVWNMWHREGSDVYCMLFGACEYRTKMNGNEVIIAEETNYPFEERLRFTVSTKTEFTLHIRIPAWSCGYRLKIDGKEASSQEREKYIALSITSDVSVEVEFLSEIKTYAKGKNVYFTKGCLTYSFGMYGERKIDTEEERASKEFPAYNIEPDEEWRWGVRTDTTRFVPCEDAEDWDVRRSLPTIIVKAKKIKNYDLLRRKSAVFYTDYRVKGAPVKKGDFTFTPPVPARPQFVGEEREIVLKPYGACKVRLTVFPKLK